MHKLTAAAAAILLVLTGSSASAEHNPVKRADPRGDAIVDVWRTTRVKLHGEPPARVRFKLYGFLGPDWGVSVSSIRAEGRVRSTGYGTSKT